MAEKISFFCDTHNFTDLSVSATVRHPLILFVAFAIIQHQGSLLSVTSRSANQQPAVHKSHQL